ncbi:hypothetical protein COMNV_01652 [Commensalibacter sp. Nvir]|uniref:DUF6587 family protein n=1 Tax=Commensalibacter sp. Nvir TaxID=3069817 RepID=UPI002D30257A|nr:hypothetical protein COMNV_01652 [Commensalibacter sp. Nvir]
MQNFIVAIVVSICAFLWISRLFPKLKTLLWKGLAIFLRILHAPSSTQHWALKHGLTYKTTGCSSCDKCNKCC